MAPLGRSSVAMSSTILTQRIRVRILRGVKPVRGAHWRCIHARGNLLCGFPHAYLYSNPACAAHFLEACRRWGKEAEG